MYLSLYIFFITFWSFWFLKFSLKRGNLDIITYIVWIVCICNVLLAFRDRCTWTIQWGFLSLGGWKADRPLEGTSARLLTSGTRSCHHHRYVSISPNNPDPYTCADPENFSRGGGVRRLFEFAGGWVGPRHILTSHSRSTHGVLRLYKPTYV